MTRLDAGFTTIHRNRLCTAIAISLSVSVLVLGASALAVGLSGKPLGVQQLEANGILPEFQKKILHDQNVSRNEYTKAVGRVKSCLTRQGIEVTESSELTNGQLTFSYGESSDPAVVQSAFSKYQECNRKYLSQVAARYAEQMSPSPADIEKARQRSVACIRRFGVEVGDDADLTTVLEASRALDPAAQETCTPDAVKIKLVPKQN